MILRPENVATITLVWGLLYKGVKLMNKKLDANQDATIEAINTKLDTLERTKRIQSKHYKRMYFGCRYLMVSIPIDYQPVKSCFSLTGIKL